jgi:hypothetical protein
MTSMHDDAQMISSVDATDCKLELFLYSSLKYLRVLAVTNKFKNNLLRKNNALEGQMNQAYCKYIKYLKCTKHIY